MILNNLQDFSESLSQVTSLDEIKQVCNLFCERIGFEYYLFGICSVTSLSQPQITTISNYPDEWFKSYFDEGMQKHDPVVKYCFEHTAPVRWDKLVLMEEYITPVGAQIMARAAECGLVNGLSIPLKAPSGEVAIFSLSTRNAEDMDTRLLFALAHAQAMGVTLFEHCARVIADTSTDKSQRLTPREIECLFWACEGKTTWEISKIIDVTERTIIFHLTSATKKLGAVNRQHAVAKAIIMGLVKPTP